MPLFAKVKKEDVNKFSSKARNLFEKILPLLNKIDPAKVVKNKCKVQTKGIKISHDILTGFYMPVDFKIVVTPKNKKIAPVIIYGSANKNIFTTAGDCEEALEEMSEREFLSRLKDYLDSILVVKSYNKNRKLLKDVYFFGFKGKLMRKRNATGVRCANPSASTVPAYSTERIIFSFTKNLSKRDINYNKQKEGRIK